MVAGDTGTLQRHCLADRCGGVKVEQYQLTPGEVFLVVRLGQCTNCKLGPFMRAGVPGESQGCWGGGVN